MNIEKIFKKYINKISKIDKDSDLFINYKNIKNKLDKNYKILITGSYSRGTAIHPLGDIDIYLILSDDKNFIKKEDPKDVFEKTEKIIKNICDNNVIINKQTHSIGINIKNENNKWLKIDLIPAIKHEKGFYIPEVDWRYKNIQRWFISNPLLHTKIINTVDNKLNKKLKPVIKLIKKWLKIKQNEYKVFKKLQAFHLEFLASQIFNNLNTIKNPYEGLNFFLLNSLKYLDEPCLIRPENKDNLIDDYINKADRKKIKKIIKKDTKIIERALKSQNKDKNKKALKKWNKVFNGDLVK